MREHPELSVGSNTDGIEVRSVGNTPILRETALIEAFNLKVPLPALPLPCAPLVTRSRARTARCRLPSSST